MARGFLVLAYVIAAACVVGVIDRDTAEISHRAAMEAPRPIFEAAHELRRLNMPCDYLSLRASHEQINAKNTRCVRADLRTEQ